MTTFQARGGLIDCRFAQSPHHRSESYAGVTRLAERIHDLRDGRPIYLRRLRVAGDGWTLEALVIHLADESDAAPLGYAVIGLPPLNGAVQYELLGAALAALMPEAMAA